MHTLAPARRSATAVAALVLGALVAALAPLAPVQALEAVAGHVVVTVTDARTEAPLPGAEVALHPADWDGVAAPLATVTSDADGAADLDGTVLDPAVPYTIRVSAPGYEPRRATLGFDPAAGRAVAVALPQQRGTVTGVVLAAESGEPLRHALVCLDDATTDTVDPWGCRLSNAEGGFSIPVLAGSYLLRVTAWERAAHVAAAPVAVGQGETVDAGQVGLDLLPELVPTTPAVLSTTTPTVGAAVTVTLPTFAEAGVLTTAAWLVGARRKPVGLGTTFVPRKQYAGKALSVVVVSVLRDRRVRTEEILVGVVAAPPAPPRPAKPANAAKPVKPAKPVRPAPAPVVHGPVRAGKAKVGRVARVKAPVVAAGATVTYQWLANGRPVKRTAKPTYKVKARQRSKAIAVRVTVAKPGHAAYVKVVRLGRAR